MSQLTINLSSIVSEIPKGSKVVGKHYDYYIRRGVSRPLSNTLATDVAGMNIAGTLIGKNTETGAGRSFMFQLDPSLESMYHIANGLETQVAMLKESCNNIQGFICGGFEPNVFITNAIRSGDIAITIAEILDKLNIPVSMFGIKSHNANLERIITKDGNINVFSKNFTNIQPEENISQEELVLALKSLYNTVKKNENHKVNLVG